VHGRINGLASLQCVRGGIGSTMRSSRIDSPAVFEGNHHGVVVSPARIHFCQKICTRDFVSDPARNATGTNPIASHKWFGASLALDVPFGVKLAQRAIEFL
jgi:hypothetical protein